MSGVAIFEWDEWQFEDDVFESRYISQIKKDAHKLYPEVPLSGAVYSANYGTYEPSYSLHTGVDFIGGSEVYTSYFGEVISTITGIGETTSLSYGNMITIDDDKSRFLYCHLENSIQGVLVTNNEFVLPGKKIGTKGDLSGYGTGPHLHYEVRAAGETYGNDVDSYDYLPVAIKSKERFVW